MKILFVTATAEPQCFGAQIQNQATDLLKNAGHDITVSDLYAQRFPAVSYADDFKTRENAQFFSLEREQAFNYKNGSLPQEIKDEQAKVKNADLVIFLAPVYWSSPPAIMRGWFDQVMTPGFAYGKDQTFANGPLQGKSAFFVMTHAGYLGVANETGVAGKLEDMLKSLHERPLNYSGMQTLAPLSLRPPYFKDEPSARQDALDKICNQIIDHVGTAEKLNKAPSQTGAQTNYPLIHINGRPGVGKKTIGSLLAKKIDAAFIDNHTLLNPAVAACGRGTEGYPRIVRKVVEAVFDELKHELQKRPVVLTNTLTEEVAEHRMYFDEIKALARKANTDLVSIELSADFNENARRIVTPSRKKSLKLTDANTLSQLYRDFSMVSDPNVFELDTTSMKAHQSAKALKRHLKDQGYAL